MLLSLSLLLSLVSLFRRAHEFIVPQGLKPFLLAMTSIHSFSWLIVSLLGLFVCLVISCVPLVPPLFGVISPSSCLFGSNYSQTCRLTCGSPGYVLEGTSARVCGRTGQWTGLNNTRCRGKLTYLNLTKLRFSWSFVSCIFFIFYIQFCYF